MKKVGLVEGGGENSHPSHTQTQTQRFNRFEPSLQNTVLIRKRVCCSNPENKRVEAKLSGGEKENSGKVQGFACGKKKMGGEGIKGTVIPYDSLFSSEQAQKAAKQLDNLIAEHQKELDKLNSFISDNTNLINLVQRLPDELSHNIMVPFGKAAFFPGRLIHTNEFLVFIGDGYHVQKTSKQTKEFLQRREMFLGSEVDSLKAMMLELKGKASLFVDTAAEAEEGIVEIREEYIEDRPTERVATEADSLAPSKEPNEKIAAGDEESDRIWTIMDELEKQEREAESITEVDEDMAIVADSECSILQHSIENKLKISAEPLNNKSSYVTPGKPLYEDHSQQKNSDRSTFEDLKVQRLPKDANMHGKSSTHKDTSVTKMSLPYPEKERLHVASTELEISKDTAVGPSSNNSLGASKAFTGSIVEHSHGLHTNLAGEITTSKSTGPSKPVSRFKMQKGSRQ